MQGLAPRYPHFPGEYDSATTSAKHLHVCVPGITVDLNCRAHDVRNVVVKVMGPQQWEIFMGDW